MKLVHDESYADIEGVSLRYDMFSPQGEHSLPAVICIHGGGWVSGDKSDMHEVARKFAAEGYAAYCPQYRLAPLYPCPAALEDCRAFVRFVRERHDKVSAFGNSAGGHLCAMLAMSPDAIDRVGASVDVSGLTDLTNPQEQHPPISWDFIGQFMGCPYVGNETKWVDASPFYQVSSDTAPMLIVHGTDDDVVWPEQSRKLHEAILEATARAELLLLDGEGHSFTERAFHRIIDKSLEFFDECGVGTGERLTK